MGISPALIVLVPFLKKLPEGHRFAIELRNRNWLDAEFASLLDRKAIEAQTMSWDKIIADRTEELASWVDFCYQIMKRGVLIYAYANNHFAGHGAATIEMFRSIWQKKGHEALTRPQRKQQRQSSLFSA